MVFVSYAREDRPSAIMLEREMYAQSIPFLRDLTLVEGDPFWRNKIAKCLKQCSIMVVLWSEHSWTSPWVEQEIRAFPGFKLIVNLSEACRTLPILEADCSRFVNPRMLVDSIRQLLPGSLRKNAGSPVRVSYSEEISMTATRKDRLAEEQQRLSRFLLTLKRSKKSFKEISEDTAINIIDGSQLKRVCTKQGTIELRCGCYLGIEPITNMQYLKFIEVTGFPSPPTWENMEFKEPDAPVVGVNWFEATAYAAWAGGTLPTEDEWLRAARAGNEDVEYATYSGCISSDLVYYAEEFGCGAPASNKRFSPNQQGFFGMCGNTWDWCASSWGQYRSIRGGGYLDSAPFCRIRARYRNAPIDRDCSVGFRIKVEV